ncbi:hypothetical protein [Streptomyces sennicomposti]
MAPPLPGPPAHLAPLLTGLGVKPLTARRGTEHGFGLRARRRAVEHVFAHPHRLRRLRIRREFHDDIHEAFLTLGCALSCRRRLVSLHGAVRRSTRAAPYGCADPWTAIGS